MKKIYNSKFLITALMTLGMLQTSVAQLSGVFTIGGIPGPGNFTSFAAAITSLNAVGVAAPGATFNVASGATFTESLLVINMTVSPSGISNPVVFQNGGVTPTVNFIGTSAANEGGFKLVGSDYVTFNGLYINDIGTSNANYCDYGFYLVRSNSTNACQNITVRNCTVDLSRSNFSVTPGACGVYVAAVDANNTACQPTSASGVFKNNSFYSNLFTDMTYGFRNAGSNVAGMYDENTQIGVSGSNTIQVGGAGTANNATSVSGIIFTNGSNSRFENNLVTTLPGNKKAVYGVRSLGVFAGTVTCISNTITVQSDSAMVTVGIVGIYMPSAATMNEAVIIQNNLVTGCVLGFPGYTSANLLRCIVVGSDFGLLSITNNTISNNTSYSPYFQGPGIPGPCLNNLWIQQSCAGIQIDGGGNLLNNSQVISGNIITNNSSRSWYSGILVRANNASISDNQIFANSLFNTNGDGQKFITGIFLSTIFINTGTLTLNVTNNLIHSLTTDNTGPARIFGIRRHYEENGVVTIATNTIHSLSAGLGEVTGIYHNGQESCLGTYTTNINTLVNRNVIYNLSTNGTSASAYGLYTRWQTPQGGAFNYEARNNFISNIKAPNSNNAVAVAGMYFGVNVTAVANYNSIKLAAASTGANFGSTGIYTENTGSVTTLNAVNNLVVNLSTPGAGGLSTAFRTAAPTTTFFAASSNNNSLYANTPGANNLIYFDGTNALQTITAYQTFMAPREINSAATNPTFVSMNDLHTNDPLIVGLGQSIPGITNDIDPQLRPNPPAVGADEPTIIILPVEVEGYNGTCVEGKAQLKWNVKTESDCDHYLVETSPDMENFKASGEIKSKGSSQTSNEYEYTVTENPKKDVYYRLSKVSRTGSVKRVGIVNVDCIAADQQELLIFPNPASAFDQLNIQLKWKENEHYSYSIIDMKGNKVVDEKDLDASGTIETGKNLCTGIYLVNIHNSSENFVKKLIIE